MVVKKQKYSPISQEKYEWIMKKYNLFYEAMGDPEKEPVSPYHPLSQKLIEELELIRNISKDLQKQKEEDMKKAAQAAKEAEEEATKKEVQAEQQEEKVE